MKFEGKDLGLLWDNAVSIGKFRYFEGTLLLRKASNYLTDNTT
jgi:hypothetical protein